MKLPLNRWDLLAFVGLLMFLAWTFRSAIGRPGDGIWEIRLMMAYVVVWTLVVARRYVRSAQTAHGS